ncbi:MAG: hypothetical protein FDZ70_02270 [Actinobacteria bacterium]|nr:MAG: hypothetical protein FDZ70_02270 [Actinomycetota bacterium]
MESRFGDDAVLLYLDASDDGVRREHAAVVEQIETAGHLYPVTVVDGTPLYDGAVSYPAVLRAVHDRLAQPVVEQ